MNWPDYLLTHSWEFLVLAALLVASAFFSGTETALFNLTRGQLYRLSHSQAKVARLVASLMRQQQHTLHTLLLGNMIVNTAYSAVTAIMVLALSRHGLNPYVAAAASVVPLLTLILVGEVTPKMLAYRLAERWALLAAAPTALLDRAFAPVVWVLENGLVSPISRIIVPRSSHARDITAEELAGLLDLSARRGLLDRDANALLREIMQLTDIRVGDIMIPRVDMLAYDINEPREQLIELFRTSRLRKLPVYDGDIDRILGVIYAKRLLLEETANVRQLVEKVPFVPEAANLERVLLQLRVTRRQMAFVVDEYGGLAGLVTLEDIIEQIVGDIDGASDEGRGEPVRRLSDSEYLIDGDLSVHDWIDAFKIDLSGQRISTVGGFVISLLGRIPAVADTAGYRNLRFTVLEMKGRRISKLRLELREEGT